MKASVWEVFRKMECLRRVDLTRIPPKKKKSKTQVNSEYVDHQGAWLVFKVLCTSGLAK